MRDGKNFDDIENLWIRNGECITKNGSRQLIDDLDSIPFPSYAKDSFIFINNDSLDTIDLAVRDKFLWNVATFFGLSCFVKYSKAPSSSL